MTTTIEEISFRVAGVTNYKKSVKQACHDIAEDNGIPEYSKYYSNLTTKEIREELKEFGDRIFKYQDLSATDVELIPEPDNKYDNNAIKVLIFNNFVGYVPSKIARTIRHYFEDDKYSFISVAEVKGGPYKEWDDYEEKVITNNDLDIGFEIYLSIVDSSQEEEVKLESSEIITSVTVDEKNEVCEVVKPIVTESFEKTTNNDNFADLSDESKISINQVTINDLNEEAKTDSASDITNKEQVFEHTRKQKLTLSKVAFAILYVFLIIFGATGIPILPILAIPLTMWSICKLAKTLINK
ncbi:HIRAN domain-containing protein [Streptococcus dysgalactiae]|uniref:HIRAN domain-containing protein n=1 Tax=Streptococcus dysgalactiae TaxID=1334 RepID=UPI0012A8BB85|nr:HIRAN domain-containing protein [Streptococcus dysgalactiae]QGH03832.1 restriction endonuclease [Streptococcus dysgalactiae subsp. dysgalactiae]WCE85191.1 HIRAN domain-containing protein [Streptococcus dysgalactiae]WCN25191.1 HIRAN domain-containing protein [Streptococcus dysgalactiae]